MLKRLSFSSKVLFKSLQIPLQILVIILYSSVIIYLLSIGLVSFVNWNLDYLYFSTWDNGWRLAYLALVVFLSATIFGIRQKFF